MFGISFTELMVIGLLILIVMGPEKIPEVARMAGKGMRELRQASNAIRDALMVDDITGNRSLPRVTRTPPGPSRAQDRGPDKPSTPLAKTRPFPTAAPTGMDQMDEADFDRLLAREYRLHHTELRAIELAARKPGGQTRLVTIPAASRLDSPRRVTLAYCPAAELAS